ADQGAGSRLRLSSDMVGGCEFVELCACALQLCGPGRSTLRASREGGSPHMEGLLHERDAGMRSVALKGLALLHGAQPKAEQAALSSGLELAQVISPGLTQAHVKDYLMSDAARVHVDQHAAAVRAAPSAAAE